MSDRVPGRNDLEEEEGKVEDGPSLSHAAKGNGTCLPKEDAIRLVVRKTNELVGLLQTMSMDPPSLRPTDGRNAAGKDAPSLRSVFNQALKDFRVCMQVLHQFYQSHTEQHPTKGSIRGVAHVLDTASVETIASPKFHVAVANMRIRLDMEKHDMARPVYVSFVRLQSAALDCQLHEGDD